ncbi:uncharacterized protein LOC134203539 [Armigeres subalbatus]|uniref:uncharacterized protein LOC134203539 n=1 Tax=Armigeres subalbatus TaxID=124917 RepID=UPI002ED542F9
MLESAGFSLKKWASNVPEALADVSPEDRAIKPVHELQDDQSVTTLGLVWDTKNDILRFNVDLPLPASILTKRKVISYIAKIFDPLGLVGPVIATAKIFMQRLWKLKNEDNAPYEWDRPLPERLQKEWKQFHATLSILAEIKIPRFVSSPGVSVVQLHFFSDASDVAYGACCYVRTLDTDHVRVSLLTSKSRVAPLATKHTTARLELCAAVLSTKLYRKVEQSIKTPSHVFFWTDSTTVIQWLQSPPSRWKTFVANRVSTIESATEISLWRHVPGNENPADELSRGMLPTDLSNQARWWSGPPWLSEFPSRWPSPGLDVPQTEFTTQEARTVTLTTFIAPNDQLADQLFARFSSYTKLRRVVAYCLKYIDDALRAKIQGITKTTTNVLLTTDLEAADCTLARLAQAQLYSEELSSNDQTIKSSPLKFLKPRLDDNGILRVGGRLSNAEIPENIKHPVILSAKHPLSLLLAEHYHKVLLHAGPQLMMATMRQKYWVIDPDGLDVLTPGHFLVGSNLQTVPEPSYINTPDNRLDHWKLTQKLFQNIWARWYPEYLAQLQSRATKCCKSPVLVQLNQIVIVKNENAPPMQWPLGRITKLHPGKDGIVRVVTLKTAEADTVVRPVAKIAILPIANHEGSSSS